MYVFYSCVFYVVTFDLNKINLDLEGTLCTSKWLSERQFFGEVGKIGRKIYESQSLGIRNKNFWSMTFFY